MECWKPRAKKKLENVSVKNEAKSWKKNWSDKKRNTKQFWIWGAWNIIEKRNFGSKKKKRKIIN
jgi:hypothetical protein